MKSHILLLCLLIATPASAQTPAFRLPHKSPQQRIVQELGLGKVELFYSRPGVKGRQMLGRYMPYDSLWRTGANQATTIRFTQPVQMGTANLDTGTYTLYTIPGKEAWTVVINKAGRGYGTYTYKKADDVARFTVPAMANPLAVETMAFQFENVKPNACELVLAWEKWMVRIPIKQDIGSALKASAEAAEKTDKPLYAELAEYYHLHAKNNPKALEMVDKAIAADEAKKEKPYWLYLDKARILKEMGKAAEARKASETSVRMAQEAKDSDYVRQNRELAL